LSYIQGFSQDTARVEQAYLIKPETIFTFSGDLERARLIYISAYKHTFDIARRSRPNLSDVNTKKKNYQKMLRKALADFKNDPERIAIIQREINRLEK